jgi:hypothetical protein
MIDFSYNPANLFKRKTLNYFGFFLSHVVLFEIKTVAVVALLRFIYSIDESPDIVSIMRVLCIVSIKEANALIDFILHVYQ